MDQKKVSDAKFFTSLKNYSPLFYLGKDEPLFLINKKWKTSFITVTGLCLAYAFSIWIFFYSGYLIEQQEENSPKKKIVLEGLNIFMFCGLFITFLLTQFLNPGIRNPDSITQQQFKFQGRKICFICEKEVLQKMYHCKQCEICVENKDHHCMFFQKCMGGNIQRKMFKFFLLFSSLSILTLFITVIFYLI